MRQLKIEKSITERTEDSLKPYLNNIAGEEMITPDEEAELARRIHQGDKKAQDRLVCANLRFVVSVAKQYQNQGLGLPDLISEGNIGLVRAAAKFDETRGFRFISYAVWWIRQAIMEALTVQGRMVRLPGNQNQLIRQIRAIQARTEQEENRPATMDEIAEELNTTPAKVSEALTAAARSASLDAPITNEEDSTLLDVTQMPDAEWADAELERESMGKELEQLMASTLKERDIYILKQSFGIGCDERSQEEIGEELGLTRERVRQIRERAILKIRGQLEKSQPRI